MTGRRWAALALTLLAAGLLALSVWALAAAFRRGCHPYTPGLVRGPWVCPQPVRSRP